MTTYSVRAYLLLLRAHCVHPFSFPCFPAMRFFLVSFLITFRVFVLAQNVSVSWTATPFNPPSFPLAVKNPYVNVWGPQGNESAPISNSWARIGSTAFTVSLCVLAMRRTTYVLTNLIADHGLVLHDCSGWNAVYAYGNGYHRANYGSERKGCRNNSYTDLLCLRSWTCIGKRDIPQSCGGTLCYS